MALAKFTRDHLGAISWDTLAKELVSANELGGDSVGVELAQIGEIRDNDPVVHAQTCLAFAIISPQCPFDVNVRATRRVVDALAQGVTPQTVDETYQIVTKGGVDSFFLAGMAARSLFASWQGLRGITPESMTLGGLTALTSLKVLRGLGPKTTAMALALWDEHSPVFTLDVWMLRGLLRLAGDAIDASAGVTITTAIYRDTQAALVAWLQSNYGGSVFHAQWSLWNLWRNDRHQTHLGIFGGDA